MSYGRGPWGGPGRGKVGQENDEEKAARKLREEALAKAAREKAMQHLSATGAGIGLIPSKPVFIDNTLLQSVGREAALNALSAAGPSDVAQGSAGGGWADAGPTPPAPAAQPVKLAIEQPDPDLQPGWHRAMDPKSRRPYYYQILPNGVTSRPTWKKPRIRTSEDDNPPQLPAGWYRAFSEAKQRWFFYSADGRLKQWQLPEEPYSPPLPDEAPLPPPDDEQAPPPPGSEELEKQEEESKEEGVPEVADASSSSSSAVNEVVAPAAGPTSMPTMPQQGFVPTMMMTASQGIPINMATVPSQMMMAPPSMQQNGHMMSAPFAGMPMPTMPMTSMMPMMMPASMGTLPQAYGFMQPPYPQQMPLASSSSAAVAFEEQDIAAQQLTYEGGSASSYSSSHFQRGVRYHQGSSGSGRQESSAVDPLDPTGTGGKWSDGLDDGRKKAFATAAASSSFNADGTQTEPPAKRSRWD
jgi:hypothetical protein